MGVSIYLDHQAQPAIDALYKADSLSQSALQIEIRWYLAQSYLLNQDTQKALPLLEWIASQASDYSNKAKSLQEVVRGMPAK